MLDWLGVTWSGWSTNTSDRKQGTHHDALPLPLVRAAGARRRSPSGDVVETQQTQIARRSTAGAGTTLGERLSRPRQGLAMCQHTPAPTLNGIVKTAMMASHPPTFRIVHVRRQDSCPPDIDVNQLEPE